MTTPVGTVNYTYDSRNRLDKVIQNSITLADYDYNAVNNLTSTTFSNGTQEIRQYDPLNRLNYLENRKSSTILSSYAYTLDKAGNRTQITEQDGRVSNYVYDDLYRLTQEKINDPTNGNRETDFVYDKVGNRLEQTETINGSVKTTGYVYDGNDRVLMETSNGQVTAYSYDNNGNTLSKQDGNGATLYTWNDEGRLVGAIVQDPNGNPLHQMGYRYNANGIRVMSSTDGQQTFYLLDEVQAYAQVVEEYDATGVIQVSYVYGNDLINQTRNSQTTFYLVDGLGSTRLLTDAQGNVLNAYDYEAFGETINQSGAAANQYLFAGEPFDFQSNNYYLRDRYYDENSGRFVRRDLFDGYRSNPISSNDYIYANDNPLNFIDPSGFVSVNEFAVANKIQNILMTSIRIGNTFFNVLNKVDTTISVIQSLQTAFNLASNPSSIFPTALNSIDLLKLPSFEDAAISLRSNSGRIVSSVLTKKLPAELSTFRTYFSSTTSTFAFFAPSIFPKLLIPTGLKIQKRSVYITSNNRKDRLFGVGMLLNPKKRPDNIQFFRMDYGPYNHIPGEDGANHDTWQDGQFHYHVPKN
jgi:RHS repeat-associated protein